MPVAAVRRIAVSDDEPTEKSGNVTIEPPSSKVEPYSVPPASLRRRVR
jgi:hypothetical protein